MNEAKPSQPASQSVAQDAIHLYSFHNDDCRYLKRLPGWRACVRACVQACLAPALPLLLLLLLLLLLPARLTCSQHHAVGLSQVVCFVVAW
jgi:hypothetical protein